ncbi:hypothetical protein [Psychroserpens sp.]|uniref:hypothetical protein n=1 Tax=Psychroserpens sp. TaxID=2020870 RepID=UPI001B0EBC2A|nr:hypothetical protein [Psychroserpens sp.]MBO6606182.1 hypothetical protein [Psychroserpens sp.]MBO6631952.1 hypothetical protein [Psychroserpens sp.]MBO6652446.1 hypothetical protein [Psychroserpens sp.]MBO6681782.1 hypothetical protein [Psychroserpens sp.]MBO6749557.1 hypothetical protein [Psychroserpens sp.]
MRILFYINAIFYALILLSYLIESYTFYGLIGQFFFGIFQFVLGLHLATMSNNYSEKVRSFIGYYWLSVLIYIPTMVGLLLLIEGSIISDVNKVFAIILMIIAPMLIATFFIRILYLIQKS